MSPASGDTDLSPAHADLRPYFLEVCQDGGARMMTLNWGTRLGWQGGPLPGVRSSGVRIVGPEPGPVPVCLSSRDDEGDVSVPGILIS